MKLIPIKKQLSIFSSHISRLKNATISALRTLTGANTTDD